MTEKEAKSLAAKDKEETRTHVEHTRPGPTFTPAVDISETDRAITLWADMPGVNAKNLDIDLRDDMLTLAGEVEPPSGPNETYVTREYRTGRYVRRFALADTIDQSKIEAELTDGVLRLVLPKAEKAVPRKIAIKAG